MRILIIEDDPDVAAYVEAALEEDNYETELAVTLGQAERALAGADFDMLLLDLNLPGGNGMDLLRTLRGADNQIPVIIITSEAGVDSRVRGLDEGSDDYLVKPFSPLELLARIRALMRRKRDGRALQLKAAGIDMDLVARTVTRDGREIELTQIEFRVLEYLLRFKEQVVSPSMLARDVWKTPHAGPSLDNAIRVHVSHLRSKLDEGSDEKMIHTVWGRGFTLREPGGGATP